MTDTEQRIRLRAYQLWEQAGRPHEHSEEFWFAARREIEGDMPPLGDRPAGAIDTPQDSAAPAEPPENVPVQTPPAPSASSVRTVRTTRTAGTQAARKSTSPDEMPPSGPKRGKPRPGKR
jgi:hypothetical protein